MALEVQKTIVSDLGNGDSGRVQGLRLFSREGCKKGILRCEQRDDFGTVVAQQQFPRGSGNQAC